MIGPESLRPEVSRMVIDVTLHINSTIIRVNESEVTQGQRNALLEAVQTQMEP